MQAGAVASVRAGSYPGPSPTAVRRFSCVFQTVLDKKPAVAWDLATWVPFQSICTWMMPLASTLQGQYHCYLHLDNAPGFCKDHCSKQSTASQLNDVALSYQDAASLAAPRLFRQR